MRADRLLSIVLLLESNERMTAGELARRLEVSPRTIQRDMEALSMAGIPVVADRGAEGGWYLSEAYRTDLTGLNYDEIKALFLNTPPQTLDDLRVRQAAQSALLKLLTALPAPNRAFAEWVQQSFYLDTPGSPKGDAALLPVLEEAMCEGLRVRLTLARERVEVGPLGLVARENNWYLAAAAEDAVRVYRLSEIRAIDLTDTSFDPPADFNLAEYWAENSARLARCPVTVRIAPDRLAQMAPGRYAWIQVAERPDTDGWRSVTILFETEEDACQYVLSFGPYMEVLEPPALRERVRRLAHDVIALYTRPK